MNRRYARMSEPNTPDPGGSDGILASLIWRARDWMGTWGRIQERVCPDGRWNLETDTITRKVWEGYNRRIVLETELIPGSGWRVWMEPPNGDILGITPRGYGVMPFPDSELTVQTPETPDELPRYPRKTAFRAAESFMSIYAMESHFR